jgi:crotonobetainyl-CoA:carnitine CoA-transferase CaiB-like acyl-CoA transferase
MTGWVAALSAAGVPCGPINTIPGVLDEPQVRHREMLRPIPHPLAGPVTQVVSPMRFEQAPLTFETSAPLLGEHTAEILGELGVAGAEIQALAARGVV